MSTYPETGVLQNEVLTVKEVATYLRVSRVTVWRWCQRGTIPAFRVGHNWRIRREDLLGLSEKSQFPGSNCNSTSLTFEPDGKDRASSLAAREQKEDVDSHEDNSGDNSNSNIEDV